MRSSTSDQPTAIRPGAAFSRPSSVMPRTINTVDAVARHMPSTNEPLIGQPSRKCPTHAPSTTTRPLAASAPGTAMRRTFQRSWNEKPRPTPNISSITPTSASFAASSALPTNPGVLGPMHTPASR